MMKITQLKRTIIWIILVLSILPVSLTLGAPLPGWGHGAANSELVPAQVDMVFLDAEHENEAVIRDLRLWAPKIRKLICGHDWAFASVRQAVNEFFGPDKVITGPGDIWQVKMEATQ